ncbi:MULTISPECIES: Flp pilus assembly protein CpaB [unclassified Sinorhizobium]|uniref:Flp pilus assembly protein CpaB n=1 Tax=unclassified Sinorhizobium TaxID=2613772 RepID=UPI0024C239BB|nr:MULTISPECIES: Flp pilus assembly protein CpaB [unclassified Sinorhizobium]MDK1375449.1 Flp pilus assembly protein CpaB [Sinorhizobium sp. 6-70]MDK1481839.1 Flp pilus assembly protein CpaB [Sinorhizobium sp. 6-117]
MRSSTIISLVIAFVLAAVAVFATRTYLADQQARLVAAGKKKSDEKTLVVAAKPMRFGDRVRSENLKVIPWPSEEQPEGSFQTIETVVGDDSQPRYAMEAIDPGEPVLASKITGAGERATLSAALDQGMKAVSIRVNDVLGVAGFVRPSDRVDVLLTRVVRQQNNSEQTYVDVLLQGVKVLAVDQTADERKDEPSVVKTVTFEVTTDEAQRLTLGATIGTLSLALRNIASSNVEQTRPITIADLGGGLISTELANNTDDGRFETIEKLVRKVGDELGSRIDSVEGKMKQPVREKQVQIVERKVEPVLPVEPKWATVGVWNTTKREEHRVGLIQ